MTRLAHELVAFQQQLEALRRLAGNGAVACCVQGRPSASSTSGASSSTSRCSRAARRTLTRRSPPGPALERLAYLLCGFALCWALLSLLGWWYLSDRRERYEAWRYAFAEVAT